MTFNRTIWLTWWIGTSLILLSWLGVVVNAAGWMGFGVTAAAVFIQVIVSRYWKVPSRKASLPNGGDDDPRPRTQ